MEHIAISVIVPIYNTKPYLAECIESILDQKINVPIEVLLIDDGSTDGCGEVCDKYAARDERVRVIHQENQGLSAARNAGIDAAKGRYYSFIDSDDVVLPRFLQTLYDACEEHDAYMSLCSVEDVQEDGKSCDPAYFTRPTQEGVFCGKDLLNEFYTPYGTVYTVAWNKMYRAEVWKLLHYPEGRLHEDDFVAHRLFWRCDKVVCIDKPLYHYRLRNGSICRTNIRPEAFDAVDGLADRYRFYVENHADRAVIDAAYAACWRRYLFLCAKASQIPGLVTVCAGGAAVAFGACAAAGAGVAEGFSVAAGVVVGLGTSCAGLSMAVSGCVQAESFCSASLRVRVRSATLLTTVRSARMPAAVAANTMARQNRYSPFSLKNCLMWFIFPRPLLVKVLCMPLVWTSRAALYMANAIRFV